MSVAVIVTSHPAINPQRDKKESPKKAIAIKITCAANITFLPMRPINRKSPRRQKENPKFVKNSIENLSFVKKYYQGTITSNDVKCSSASETILISNQGNCTTCLSSYGDIKRQNLQDVFSNKERIEAQRKIRKCSWPCLLPCFCDM